MYLKQQLENQNKTTYDNNIIDNLQDKISDFDNGFIMNIDDKSINIEDDNCLYHSSL